MEADTTWRDSASCADKPQEWFFPDRSNAHDMYRRGREVCATCPVKGDCLAEHHKAERETGMVLPGLWGGQVMGTSRRQALRRSTPRSCVVCGASVFDKGTGHLPLYCSGPCRTSALYARRRGGAA